MSASCPWAPVTAAYIQLWESPSSFCLGLSLLLMCQLQCCHLSSKPSPTVPPECSTGQGLLRASLATDALTHPWAPRAGRCSASTQRASAPCVPRGLTCPSPLVLMHSALRTCWRCSQLPKMVGAMQPVPGTEQSSNTCQFISKFSPCETVAVTSKDTPHTLVTILVLPPPVTDTEAETQGGRRQSQSHGGRGSAGGGGAQSTWIKGSLLLVCRSHSSPPSETKSEAKLSPWAASQDHQPVCVWGGVGGR